jgi:hypothetical protein
METKKLNFKAGDIVKVLPYSWYDFFKNKEGNVLPEDVGVDDDGYHFTAEMAERCGDYLEIVAVVDNVGYRVR